MKILTQITQQHRDIIAKENPRAGFKIDIVFEDSYIDPLKITDVSPMSVDNINFLLNSFEVTPDEAKIIVKQMDQLLKSKGYRGKQILAHTLHKERNGDVFLESDQYAVAIVK